MVKRCILVKYVLPAVWAALLVLAGCNSPLGSYQAGDYDATPQYGTIAKESMAYEGPQRNPVIMIHGFLGAKLKIKETGAPVWGKFYGMESRNLTPELLRGLSCKMVYGKPLDEIEDSTGPDGVLDRVEVKVLGMTFHLDAYDGLRQKLVDGGYILRYRDLPQGKHFYTLFDYYYDWRYDLAWNAAQLHAFILRKRAYMQKEYERCYGLKDYDVQFDLIGHSMGGLLSRYYMMYGDQDLPADGSLPVLDWRGSRYVDKAVIVATPNAGYLDTFWEMVNGLRLQEGAPLYPPGVIGTFHTYYQMMPPLYTRSVVYADDPKGAPVDLFDPAVWRKYRWGLADPEQDEYYQMLLPDVKSKEERFKIALDHLEKCLKRAEQFVRAMNVRKEPPSDVAMVLFAGDAFQTRRQAFIDRETGKIVKVTYEPGDGKVLSTSARCDLREGQPWHPFISSPIRWTSVMYLPAAHMGITESPVFVDNLLYFLLVTPTRAQEGQIK